MRTDLQRLKRDAEAGRVAVASADHLGSTSHVGTAALGRPAERSSAASASPSSLAVELRSNGQPRAAVPTWTVVTVATVLTYKDFLMLWKDADPEIPILKQAKAEYAKLP
jgi:hypothetical protein